MNAVKTGLCGRAVLLADEEEAAAYREHVARVYEWWAPDSVEEYAPVQSVADTPGRWESIPGLESALSVQARLRGTPLLQHPDPVARRLLLTEAAAQQRREEQACQRAERKQAREAAAANPDGFEFSTEAQNSSGALPLPLNPKERNR